VVWPCGKNAGLWKTKTGKGSLKGETKRERKTKEDLGGLCDRWGEEKMTLADMKRLALDRIALRQWTLQGDRDKEEEAEKKGEDWIQMAHSMVKTALPLLN
jgi:hypothetical protein